MKIPFFHPSIDESTVASVSGVLRSGWLTTGEITRQFENDFKAYVGSEHAVMLNSGTAALHLSLAAVGLKPEDEVKFVNSLKEELILAVPGSGFGCPGYFRIAFCVDDDTIINALPGFKRVMDNSKNK